MPSPLRRFVCRLELLLLAVVVSGRGLAMTVLHDFVADGRRPASTVVLDAGGVLYGVTPEGGAHGQGTIFKISSGGAGYQLLHSFAGEPSDGRRPLARLTIDGTTLYGTTYQGGANDQGTVFKLQTDGSGYTILRSFGGTPSDGAWPESPLFLSGTTLYGTTLSGGSSNNGTVFKISTDGTGYSVLQQFAGGSAGRYPSGALAFVPATQFLYGTTESGGTGGVGTVYRVRADGALFGILKSFAGTDGNSPRGGLVLEGSVLYGMTYMGGTSNLGTIFRIQTDAGGFAVLRSFAGAGVNDGAYPNGGLTLGAPGILYGTTADGGVVSSTNYGIVFRIQTDGGGFTRLYDFPFGGLQGRHPSDTVAFDGTDNLYGTTSQSGVAGMGTIFTLKTNGSGYTALRGFLGVSGRSPDALVRDGAGQLYGTTYAGGADDRGSIFRVAENGTGYTTLYSFQGGASDGQNPNALVYDGAGTLYGTTVGGGPSGTGTIFKISTNGTGYQVLHLFAWGAGNGVGPVGPLVLDGAGNLFGATENGGASNQGTVFTITTTGALFTILRSFSGGVSDGSSPAAGVILDGTDLYGTTRMGGASNQGTVFKLSTDGMSFSLLRSFAGAPSDGSAPRAELLRVGGTLFGTTAEGGAADLGTLFSVGTNGTSYYILRSFTGSASDGSTPTSPVIMGGSTLLGTTRLGGSGFGTVYSIRTNGTGFAILHSFAGPSGDGAEPRAGLLAGPAGTLFGSTTKGGTWNAGTLFTLCAASAGVTGGGTICGGAGSAFIGANLSGTPPWSITWSDGFVQPGVLTNPVARSVSPGVTTTYTITSLLDAYCSGTSSGSALVTAAPALPTPTASSNSPICQGGTLQLSTPSVSGADYQWTGPNDFYSEDQNPTIAGVTPAESGVYQVTVYVDGCTSSPGSTSVSVSADTVAPAVTAPAPVILEQSLCCGGFGGITSGTNAGLASFLGGASALDACDTTPTPLSSRIGLTDITPSTCLESGASTVTFRYQDDALNIGTATSTVNVRMFGDLNLDTMVDGSDYVILRDYLNFVASPEVPPFNAPLGLADLNHDATVDPSDFVVIRDYMNFVTPCLAP